jgi:hypothetical protein
MCFEGAFLYLGRDNGIFSKVLYRFSQSLDRHAGTDQDMTAFLHVISFSSFEHLADYRLHTPQYCPCRKVKTKNKNCFSKNIYENLFPSPLVAYGCSAVTFHILYLALK